MIVIFLMMPINVVNVNIFVLITFFLGKKYVMWSSREQMISQT